MWAVKAKLGRCVCVAAGGRVAGRVWVLARGVKTVRYETKEWYGTGFILFTFLFFPRYVRF